ncbi:MAG: sporulation protein YunB [Clostridiales bacterium]|nr:sporulation protein YunB [Clostridiales bacterium]
MKERKQKNRKRKKHVKLKIILLLLFAAIVVVYSVFRNNAKHVIMAVSEARVKAMTTTSVNLAIYETLNGISYSDLIDVIKDEKGEIAMLSANAVKVNRLARDTAYLSQRNLELLGTQGVEIPIGAFTGSKILAGFGPEVTIKIIPVGSVNCDFFSEYETVGINQTLHKIYMEAVADVDIILPGYSIKVSVPTQIFVCESILVGKVPDTYVDADGLGSKYNF